MRTLQSTWPAPLSAIVLAAWAAACGGSGSPATPSGGTSGAPQLDSAYAAARQQNDLTSLVVAQGGEVVRQEYFNGGGADTPQDVRSVTKSVMSLLVGIALDRGCLRSVDQPIGEILGSLGPTDPAKAAITVRQLLTMTSGLGNDELLDVGEFNRWAVAPDQMAYVWALPVQAPPGTRFTYYSPAFHVLSPVVTRACGQPTADFASAFLFGPLGIGARPWETDQQGFANGAAGLQLTPRDMVAIGNLVLAGGSPGGRQVVSAGWIGNATRQQVGTGAQPYASGYGFGWWTGQAAGGEFALANGYGGQFIVVSPRARVVVSATTRWQGVGASVANAHWRAVLDIIMQRILPAF